MPSIGPTVGALPWAMNARDVLLRAVQTQVRMIVASVRGTRDPPPADRRTAEVDAQVLASLSALDALQSALTRERQRCRRIERELLDARAALARSRAELATARHGERHAHHLASHDSLTTLPNRRFFTERLDQALTRLGPACQDIAVVYLDLDGLKSINDRYGHDTGDQLLKIAAARLRGALRAQDIVCRLGGDEFACLLIDSLSRPQLEHLACKLFDAVSAPMQIGGQSLVVCPSIGIATGDSGSDGPALLKQADAAMYCAKREQSGYAFFGLLTMLIASEGNGAQTCNRVGSSTDARPRSSISLSEPHRPVSTPEGSAGVASDSSASMAGQ